MISLASHTVFFFALSDAFRRIVLQLRFRIKRQVPPMGSGMSESKDCDFSWRGKKTSNGTRVITTQSRLLRSISRRCYILSEHRLPDVASRLAGHSFPEFERRSDVGRTKKARPILHSSTPSLHHSGYFSGRSSISLFLRYSLTSFLPVQGAA